MNPSFWLLYGLSDIDLMLTNSSVVFYGLLNDVIIIFNWCIIGLRFIILYWADVNSLSIILWCIELIFLVMGKGLIILN